MPKKIIYLMLKKNYNEKERVRCREGGRELGI